MNRASFAHRYLDSLIGNRGAVERAVPRAQAGYSFWHRYWASFTGAGLSPRQPPVAATSTSTFYPKHSSAGSSWTPVLRSDSGWAVLPRLPEPATFLAGSEDDVVVKATTAKHDVELYVRRSPVASYRAELVVRGGIPRPLVVALRYRRADDMKLLFVPLVPTSFGPSSAQVDLPGLAAGENWEMAAPVEVDESTSWDAEAVKTSVASAVNEATRKAWRTVALRAAAGVAALINEALS